MARLEIDGLGVRLGGHDAVQGATLAVDAGRITGLIGPNGAGKTALFDAVCGLQPALTGRIRLDGADITRCSAHERARRGMARTFQRLETFTYLTVGENVRAGCEFRRSGRHRREVDPGPFTDELIERLGLDDVVDERVDRLSTGRARLVEIGRALASRPRVLLLDEPSAGLDGSETDALAALLGELRADGMAILMVEHDMRLVMGTCDDIFVLQLGQVIASGAPAEVRASAVVQAAYLGGSDAPAPAVRSTPGTARRTRAPGPLDGGGRPAPARHAPPPLAVAGMSAGYGGIDVVTGVTFAVEAGEVLALLGPNGAGKTTTLGVVAGLVAPTRGSIRWYGRELPGATADDLARAGLRMVPEGRGIFPNLSVAENLWMSTFTGTDRDTVEARSYARFPRLAQRRHQVAGTMSGGEQQMLAMARALATDPGLLVLDELSMGLAPIVIGELYEAVAELAAQGIAVLVVEQFAREALAIADRAAIMLSGRIVRLGSPAEIAGELEAAYLTGSASRRSGRDGPGRNDVGRTSNGGPP